MHHLSVELSDDEKVALLFETVAAMKVPVAANIAAIYGVVSSDEGELSGTGTFIRLNGGSYLLTAAHVFDGTRRGYGGFAHSTVPGSSPRRISNAIQCISAPSDLALVGVELPAQSCPVSVEQLSPTVAGLQNDILFFQGYPGTESRFSRLFAPPAVVSRSLPYGTVLGRSSYKWFDPTKHVAVEYPGEGNVDEAGRAAALPAPHGLSGTLLWKTNRTNWREGWSPSKAQAIGVITHWDSHAQSLIATRIEVVARFLLDCMRREQAYFNWLARGSPLHEELVDWRVAETDVPRLF